MYMLLLKKEIWSAQVLLLPRLRKQLPSFINPWFRRQLARLTVIKAVPDGAYTILDPIVTVRLSDGSERDIALAQKWPIRVPRPTYKRFPASVPLGNRTAYPGYSFPNCKGWYCSNSWWIRYRKNHDTSTRSQSGLTLISLSILAVVSVETR